MVMKAEYFKIHYPQLDFRPVKNYFGSRNTYDVVWFHDYDSDDAVHLAVLKEDHELKLFRPEKTLSLFENLKTFKEMLDLECNDIFWKSLMRDVVRHNVDKKSWCSEACQNFPLCSTIYNVLKPWSCDMG